ncbi:MAG: acetolactate synthase [Rhodothalassiaceae bacterium]|nr:MAG: acetolactate synthase [Rhodothalassiaceae bacterium]
MLRNRLRADGKSAGGAFRGAGSREESAADALLAGLAEAGIRWLFANAGTDFAPLLAAYVRAGKTGRRVPRPVTAAHESVAVAAAHGAHLATGTPQAVMVHVSVGLANALSQVMNAHREDIPLLIMAGRTPFTEAGHPASRDVAIHWGQELFDQAAALREITRWQGQLARADQIGDLLHRALAVATGPDPGPVYLELPREPLADPLVESAATPPQTRTSLTAPPAPDPEAVDTILARLAAAERPLLITQRAGRAPAAFALLARFAEKMAIPVIEYRPNVANLPDDHPWHAGFAPPADLAERDAILLLDCPVPWLPARHADPRGAFIAEVAPDPFYRRWPMRRFPADIRLAAGAASFLEAALERFDQLEPALKASCAARGRRPPEGGSAPAKAGERAGSATNGCLDAASATRILASVLPEDAVVFNELGALRPFLRIRRPGGFFGPPNAGALGWAHPAALGYKLARPDAFVVATVGDGSAIFANPVACHQLAVSERLAVLVVVFNNRRWDSVRWAATSVHPELAGEPGLPLVALEPSPDFAGIARASGIAAWRAGTTDGLRTALREAVAEIAAGRPALVEIAIA